MIYRAPTLWRRVLSFLGPVVLCQLPCPAALVINEIMFRPPGAPEPTGQEYIELLNYSNEPLDLTGARFTKGVTFAFPAGTVMEPGALLIVAANRATFDATHPGIPAAKVLAPWTGSLSNSGENLEVTAADGVTILALVKYSTEGDWGARTRVSDNGQQGWEWISGADGTGKSLELISPLIDPANGQSWSAGAAAGGTPAADNSVAAAAIAPVISGVAHSPVVPRSTDTVKVRANVGTIPGTQITATLHWRISNASPGAFQTLPMQETTAGKWQAELPAQPVNTVVEFYVSAAGGTNSRSWPAPTTSGQTANCQYQVDESTSPAGIAKYRLIMTVPEAAQFASMTTHTDAAVNATFIGDDGTGPAIRYLAGLRYRGASSRDFVPAPNRITLAHDRPWNGMTKLNLNSKYTWLQFIGMKLMQASGLRAPETRRVFLTRNGVNAMGSASEHYGSWVHVEPLGGEFVENHFPLDDKGDLYKKVRPDNDWAYRNGSGPAYEADGWIKSNNSSADNWGKLDSLMRVMNQSQTAPDYYDQVQTVADVQQWARWFAAESLLTNGETNASNGADDDYSLFFGGDPVAQFIPHDLDTILGQGDSSRLTNTQHTLFDMTERSDTLGPLLPLFGTATGGGNAQFRSLYFRTLRELCLTSFSAPHYGALLDQHLTGWVPAATIGELKNFMNARRTWVLGQCATALGESTPAAPAGTAQSVTTLNRPAVSLNEVLAKATGAAVDFVELRNNTASAADLSGMKLTVMPAGITYTFPAGTSLAAGAFMALQSSGVTGGGPVLPAEFDLDADGGSVTLFKSAADGGSVADRINWGVQVPNASIGRTGADGRSWTLVTPTPGADNGPALTLGNPSSLVINEWLAAPQNRGTRDFIELYNPSPNPVPMGGLRLTDDAVNYPRRYIMADLSFIAANGYDVFEAVGDSATPGNGHELPFSLAADHDWICLIGNNSVVIDQVNIAGQAPDRPGGRIPDGASTFTSYDLPTPGMANASAAKVTSDPAYANASALANFLRITEVMYRPNTTDNEAQDEYIEFKNTGTAPLSLAGVRVTDGVSFEFPAMTLQPGAYTLIVADTARFETLYGAGLPIAGQMTGQLSNSGERITVKLPLPFDADIQTFVYHDDWYPETDGAGRSLVIRSSRAALTSWDAAEGWVPVDTVGGTPGSPGVPVITSPATAAGTVGVAFNYRIEAANEPVSFAAQPLPRGLGFNENTGTISGFPLNAGTFPITISASSSAGTKSAPLILTVSLPPAPVITSNLAVSASLTAPFNYVITATNNPTAYAASNLPAWLTFNSNTRTLTGQPTVTGTYTATISAYNPGGSDTRELTILVQSDAVSAALDGLGLTYTRGGNAQWSVRTSPTHDGVDSLQSGDIGDSQESWVETTATGPDSLSFWWRVDSESGWDYLHLNVDGETVTSISGSVDWAHVDYVLPEGPHTIRWVYRKDSSASNGADAGWLDEVKLASQVPEPVMISPYNATAFQGQAFSWQILATKNPTSYTATGLPAGLSIDQQTGLISGTPTAMGVSQVSVTITGPTGSGVYVMRIDVTSSDASISAAVDGANVVLKRGGDSYWFSQNTTTHDGVDAIRSGPLSTGQQNWVELTLTGPDRVWFWWRFSATEYWDYFYFEIDESWQNYIAQDSGWQRIVYDVPPGEHTLRWRFEKSSSSSTGLNGAFLDQIVVASLLPEPAVVSALSVTGEVGEPFTYNTLATKSPESYSATSLPPGLSIDPVTGVISGTPTAIGSSTAMISATSGGLTGTTPVEIHIASSRDSIMSALDSEGIEYSMRFGPRLWGAQTAVTRDGTDAVAAPLVLGESTLGIKVTGPDRLGYWWKLGNTSGYLYLTLDNLTLQYFSGVSDWQQTLVDIPPGEHTLRWTYYQYSDLPAGTATAFIDKVQLASQEPLITSPINVASILRRPFSYQVTASGNPQSFTATNLPAGLALNPATGLITGTPTVAGTFRTILTGVTAQGMADGYVDIGVAPDAAMLAAGGDGTGLTWNHSPSSNNLWFTQTTNTHDGVDALQSGTISHNQSTGFTLTVQGRGTLRGWWRASSEQWSDRLTCTVNGSYGDEISGNTQWQEFSINVNSTGTSVIQFMYSKDGSTSTGSDACWVDQISFTPADSDEDGLSDAWEQSHFSNLTTAAGADDPDSDGWTNAQEQAAGTDPLDPSSSLRMLSGARSGNGFNLQWASVPGRTYLFQSSPDLTTWTTQPFRFYASEKESSFTAFPLVTAVTTQTLLAPGSAVKAFVPTSDPGNLWQGGSEAAFTAAGGETNWISGAQGVGYENDPNPSDSNVPFTSFIGTDVKSRMFNQRTSVYVRLHFPVANPLLIKSLLLGLRFDDGFVAYLNGVRVAAENAPGVVAWNAAATQSRSDNSAVAFKNFDLTGWTQLLQPGDNILAIHGMNQTTGSSDLLFQAQLTGTLYNIQSPPAKMYWRTAPQ